jgi:hypothetical protein
MKNKMDLESFLSWLDVRMKNSSVEVNHSIEGSTHTYILKHDLGENYSLFQKTVLGLIFNDVLRKRIYLFLCLSRIFIFLTLGLPRISHLFK